jgi:hypothetical protein
MVPMVRSKVTTNSKGGVRAAIVSLSVTVGFYGNHSFAAQRFIDACSRVGIPLRSDLNTPQGTLGVAKVSRFDLRFPLVT